MSDLKIYTKAYQDLHNEQDGEKRVQLFMSWPRYMQYIVLNTGEDCKEWDPVVMADFLQRTQANVDWNNHIADLASCNLDDLKREGNHLSVKTTAITTTSQIKIYQEALQWALSKLPRSVIHPQINDVRAWKQFLARCVNK